MDFVIRYKGCVTAIEVTSSLRKDALPDMDAFAEEFRPRQKLLIGGRGIPLEKFLSAPPPRAGWRGRRRDGDGARPRGAN